MATFVFSPALARCERACKAPKRDTAQKWPTRREKSPSFRQKARTLFMDRRPFFHHPKRMSKQNGYICAKRAPTCADLLHFAAEGAHRHRTDGR